VIRVTEDSSVGIYWLWRETTAQPDHWRIKMNTPTTDTLSYTALDSVVGGLNPQPLPPGPPPEMFTTHSFVSHAIDNISLARSFSSFER
jgi:hypothetical protein